MNIAMIFAGGSGVRMGSGIPKQFLEINGKPILVHTVQNFQWHSQIDKIYISTLKDYIPYVKALIDLYRLTKVADVIPGGNTAQDSIYNCLKRSAEEDDPDSIVLLHDGVRPVVTHDTITKNIEMTKKKGNAITTTPCFETILISKNGDKVDLVPYRRQTFSAQAPQTFHLGDILHAHDKIRSRPEGYKDMVDACTILTTLGYEVNMVEGNRGNIKVTTPEDVYLFRAMLQYSENEQAFGYGSGSMDSMISSFRKD
ncbi:MAG: IspD/TarI family cytidylyltransferase [Anaerovoracaceae bacterium]|jgi:2-C-methyl-D-erythritol 4-phosphate cytidylyltransferase